jgi:hypothetical protein
MILPAASPKDLITFEPKIASGAANRSAQSSEGEVGFGRGKERFS